MSTLPLEVHEVLEEEYVSMYGPIDPPRPAPDYTEADVLDEGSVRTILSDCGVPFDGDVVTALNTLLGASDLMPLEKSPELTDCGKDLLEHYGEYTKGASDGLRREINRRITDDAFSGSVKLLRDVRLAHLYERLHERPSEDARAAICISGGGIRSATFALGVLQGLAGADILDKFHYLSTVSGGGYIGSWLSSWARRHPDGIRGVQDELVRADTAVEGTKTAVLKTELPATKIDPEPRPLRHLRAYSNYLSPKLGLLSGDTWTMASLYLRNLLLNLLVLVPLLAAALAMPRFYSMLLRHDAAFGRTWLLWINVIAIAVGFGYIGAARPTVHGRHARWVKARGSAGFLGLCAFPLLVASGALSLYWAKIADLDVPSLLWRDRWYLAAVGLAMTIWPAVIYYLRYFTASPVERREPLRRQHGFWKKFSIECLAAFVGLATLSAILYLLADKLFDHPVQAVPDLTFVPPFLHDLASAVPVSELYVCFAAPLILLAFFVQNAAFVGVSSIVNEDYDREWWARGGALLLMTGVFLGLACYIAVFGPVLLYRAPILVSSVGGVSGLLAGVVGFSSQTPAGNKKDKGGKSSALSNAALGLAVPLFVIVFLAAISLATTVIIQLVEHDKVQEITKWLAQVDSSASVTQTSQSPAGNVVAKYETEKTPFLSLVTVNGVEHLKTVHATNSRELFYILAAALVALVLSTRIGVNRFSMHGLYRNRLIRAYLGASRFWRDPDAFTGFDPHDNVQMYELHHHLLWATSFTDVPKFVRQLLAQRFRSDSVEQTVWNSLDKKTWHALEAEDLVIDPTLTNGLVQSLNAILTCGDLGGVKPDDSPALRLRRNRDRLQVTFSSSLAPPHYAPMHVVNTALNLTAGGKLAWQQRKAESFTVTPLHAGSLYVGYRDAKEYGGKDGISLGTSITISGAAASPNQGYHSSPATAFLMTILNVRLGSWLGNPGLAGGKTYKNADPWSNLEPLVWELTGSTNDQCPLVYLSDGGHFENLGIYEMVLRRCRYIVVSDGGCDPKCSFEDLGNAIRKIRTDLGVPIDIEYDDMHPRSDEATLRKGRYVTTARIRYSAIDEPPKVRGEDGELRDKDIDGTLVYIKPGLYEGDYFPKDVYNYATESIEFPHESTADQFFSESQFESYRALGRHAFNEICGNYTSGEATFAQTYPSVAGFATDVKKNAPKMTSVPPEHVIAGRIDNLTKSVNSVRIPPALRR